MYKEAEKTFRKDLLNNNDNVWALRGLYEALIAQKKKEAASIRMRLTKASVKADKQINSSAY
jgi:hypothetical protein